MKGVSRIAVACAAVLLFACGGDSAESPAEPAAGQPAAERPSDQPKAFGDMSTHLDLWALAHLAEVDHHGQFIDFGTPARAKYSFGDWRSGWGADETSGQDTFNYAEGNTGRLFVSVDERADQVLKMRLKPIGTRVLTVYVNGEAAASVRFTSDEWGEYDVAIPADKWVAGENRLLLRFGGTTKFQGKDVAVAMAWAHLMPAADAADTKISRPVFPSMRTELEVGGVQRRALAVRAPTTLRYYVDVPEGAKLGFGFGIAGGQAKGVTATITVKPEGGASKQLFKGTAGGKWSDQVISLADFAGQVVRIDMAATGDAGAGRVAWSTPAVLTPRKVAPKLEKPAKNVVVLLIDTLGAHKLKAYKKSSRVKTPALDRVAQEGAVFLSAQAPENWTKPSVASVLTSLWPATHATKTDGAKLPQAATMLSEVYKGAGFATGSFIANGYVSDRFGFDQGWDYYTNFIREKKSTEAENVFKEAGDWIEKHKDQRFFAYVQTIDPHVPYDPPGEYLDMYAKGEYAGPISPRKTPDQLASAKRNPPKITFTPEDKRRLRDLHDAEISYHDHYMGLFIERLKKLGLYEDTIFVVTSDHGEEFEEHGSWGHGHSVYQELIGVPFIVRWPAAIKAGQRIDRTVSTIDIFPTVLEANGVAVPDAAEGDSMLGVLRGGTVAGPAVAFSDFLDDRRVIRAGRWKLILRGTNLTFFDLQKDPGELNELNRRGRPIAARYCSLLLGQFLGSTDRRHWLEGSKSKSGGSLESENAQMDDTLREQLKALGYAGDEPAAETN